MTSTFSKDQIDEHEPEQEPEPDARFMGRGGHLDPKPARFAWTFITRYQPLGALWLVLVVAVGAGVESFQPYVFGALVDSLTAIAGISEPSAQVVSQTMTWFSVLAIIWIAGPLFDRSYWAISAYVIPDIRAKIQEHAFTYVLDHSPSYFLETMPGSVAQKIRQAANSTVSILEIIALVLPRIFVLLSVAVVLLWGASPNLVPIFGVFAIALLTVAWGLARRCQAFAKDHAEAQASLTGRLVDAVSNWSLVRTFARDTHERWRLSGYLAREWRTSNRLRLSLAVMRIVLHIVTSGFLVAIIWLAVRDCLAGELGVGDLTMIVTLSLLIAVNINWLGDSLLFFFEQLGTLSDALETTATPHAIVDAPDAKPLEVTQGFIEFRDACFSFADGKNVFKNLSLRVESGERVALVGPSGAGKSTLIKLLRRHFILNDGQILIDGQDITEVAWHSIHEQIAEVPQDAGVFHRSIQDNIRYGRTDASDAEVAAAAKAAHCHDFIMARKHGYESVVGERGMKLSGGERQRIAIARAFLKDSPILILDEATSSLDSEVEHLIQDALTRLVEGRTVLAIAHRLSTVMHMDRIVFIDRGTVIEEGTHADLLKRDGAYAAHWRRQSGGFA